MVKVSLGSSEEGVLWLVGIRRTNLASVAAAVGKC